MYEEDQKLLAAAHAAVRDAQRKLHGLAEEARLQYQQRVSEWEQCRRSLEELATLLNSQGNLVEVDSQPDTNLQARVGLIEHETQLREKHGELAERVYRLQRSLRLLNTTIRRLEKESGRLLLGGDGLSTSNDDEELPTDSHERILQASEQERIRLAREIHDGPAQIMANAIFEMEFFERLVERDPAAVRDQLAQLKADMRDGLTEVRRFIFDLRPPSLTEEGIFEALRGYLENFEKHFGITVEIELPKGKHRLPGSKEVALFRIVQEALQNVQKHAGASKIAIRGKMTPAVLQLSIEDNGRGFALAEVASRHSRNLGLISMRERAELIDAQLDIVTAPGRGTRISLVVPLGPSSN
ncbi:MAG: sensor histidine kinase [Chloroflexota bacterium]